MSGAKTTLDKDFKTMTCVSLSKLCNVLCESLYGQVLSVEERAEDQVVVKLSCDDWEKKGSIRNFDIVCDEVAEVNLIASPCEEMAWFDQHILLWGHNLPHYNLFYNSVAENAYEVIGKLCEAHQSTTPAFQERYRSVNAENFLTHHKDGHGLLAHGPLPLMKVYRKAISSDLSVNIVQSYKPLGGYSVILFECGHIIARSFKVIEAISKSPSEI